MSKTSTAVKQRYINKTYDNWSVRLKHADYDRVDELRGKLNMSRSQFLLMLVDKYEEGLKRDGI